MGLLCHAEGSHFIQYIQYVRNYHVNKNLLTEIQGKVKVMKLEANKLGKVCSAEHLWHVRLSIATARTFTVW